MFARSDPFYSRLCHSFGEHVPILGFEPTLGEFCMETTLGHKERCIVIFEVVQVTNGPIQNIDKISCMDFENGIVLEAGHWRRSEIEHLSEMWASIEDPAENHGPYATVSVSSHVMP